MFLLGDKTQNSKITSIPHLVESFNKSLDEKGEYAYDQEKLLDYYIKAGI